MKVLAIIPARGGSKRIPRKNIKKFFGSPIIKYSIDAAKQSKIFDEIMVSTDDKEIAEISEKFGAKVPFLRSKKNSSDKAMTVPVLEEVLSKYKDCGKVFDYVCCIYPTAPFISYKNIQKAYLMIVNSNFDAVLPVMKYSYPIQRSLRVSKGLVSMNWPENYNCRSQDLEPAYHDCGQFYFLKVSSLIKQKTLYPKYTMPIFLSENEAQDIDNEEDWKLAEIKYMVLKGLLKK